MMPKLIPFYFVLFFAFSCFQSLAQPINDNVCNAILLTVDTNCNGYDYTNEFADAELGEPNCTSSEANTVWFKFVAPASGRVEVSVKRGSLGNARFELHPFVMIKHKMSRVGDSPHLF